MITFIVWALIITGAICWLITALILIYIWLDL